MTKKTLLLIAALLVALSPRAYSWDFKTAYFKIEVDPKGYITSMKNTTVSPAREFSPKGKPSPLLSLYDSQNKVYFEPQKAAYDKTSGEITLEYGNGSVAKVIVEPQTKYLRLTLRNLAPRNTIDAIQWGSYYTTINNLLGEIIGVARDTSELVNYSIGVLALNDNTIGGTADVEGDAAPFQYIIHTPDATRFPLPDSLHEGQIFTLGGDGISDVAFYANKEPYYRIMYGNAAQVDEKGQVFLNYQSKDRTKSRTVFYSLIPNMLSNKPNHIDTEPIAGVDFIGSSVALWGAPDDIALLDVIQDVVLSEGLPYPTVNGRWVKDPAAYLPDLVNDGPKCDSLLSYALQLGFKAIYAHEQGFLRPDRANDGYLDGKEALKKPFQFTEGNRSHKEFAQMAAAEGVMLGRVCVTNALAPGTLDASPAPSDSLCYQQKRILTKALSPQDTLIYVDDSTYLNEIASWEGHCENLNIIKIGKELIHYLGVTDTQPYRLKNVTRGYWGSTATDHKPGDTIYKLQVTINYGYEGLIPNLALQDEIARYYAQVALHSGLTYYDFDGQEFLFNNGHGYYSAKRFFGTMFKTAADLGVPYIRFTGATLSEGSWHYQSIWNVGGGRNLYDIDTRQWGSATSQGKDLRDVTFSNYFPVSFGGNFHIKDTSTVEQYEHVQAIAVGYGATYGLGINQDDVEKCPQKFAIFKAIKTWEEARAANAFPGEVKNLLRDPRYDWKLEAKGKNSWELRQLRNGAPLQTYKLSRAQGY